VHDDGRHIGARYDRHVRDHDGDANADRAYMTNPALEQVGKEYFHIIVQIRLSEAPNFDRFEIPKQERPTLVTAGLSCF
jgi:hypothetical protein